MEGTHKNLLVWKESMELAKQVYQLCNSFPPYETYALADQMRRSAVSIPSNIAEGYGRGSNKEIIHFLNISLGSASELETQLMLSSDFGYISAQLFELTDSKLSNIIKMLRSLINKRKQSEEENPKT